MTGLELEPDLDGAFDATPIRGFWCGCGWEHCKVALLDADDLVCAEFGLSRDDWLRWFREAKPIIEAGEPPALLS